MKTVGTNLAELDTLQEVFEDMATIGGQGARHFKSYDLSWFSGGIYESGSGMSDSSNYNLDDSRIPVFKSDTGIYSIPTLYAVGPSTQARYLGYVAPECKEVIEYIYMENLANENDEEEKAIIEKHYSNFFDENGMLKGSSIGIKGNDQLNQLVISLLNSQPFPDYSGVNNNETSNLSFSTLKKKPSLQVINPRSHS